MDRRFGTPQPKRKCVAICGVLWRAGGFGEAISRLRRYQIAGFRYQTDMGSPMT